MRDVLVLDRNYSPGAGGALHQELCAALYGMPDAPRFAFYPNGPDGLLEVPITTVRIIAAW